MPSEQEVLQKAEDFKNQGNSHFSKSELDDAISAYSQGLVQVDRAVPPPVALKTALLSNRAACFLKKMSLQDCIDDCTKALDILQESSSEEPKLRSKLLFRRAKASFLKANLPGQGNNVLNELLQGAAKDLLALLSFDPKNKEASNLLTSIRAQHAIVKKSYTPLSKTLDQIKDFADNDSERAHKLRILGGLLDSDPTSASMELGRLGGVPFLLELAQKSKSNANNEVRIAALNCLACAGGHPKFVRAYLKDVQAQVVSIVKTDGFEDVSVAGMSILIKCVLHLDRDEIDKPVVQTSNLEDRCIIDACIEILHTSTSGANTAVRGVMEILSVMTCGRDRSMIIRTAIASNVTNVGVLDGIPAPVSKADINAMTAKELADYRQRQSDLNARDVRWSKERAKLFLDMKGLEAILKCAAKIEDHFLRREMTVVIGKIMTALESEDEVKKIVKPVLMAQKVGEDIDDHAGLTIEEVYNEDEDEKHADVEEEEAESLQSMMERAELTVSLLLAMKEVGAWAICTAWMLSDKELVKMVDSGEDRPMAIASEVLSAAASVAESRHMVTMMMDAGSMEKLLMHDDRDIRSGAAAAVAKLGLAGRDKDKAEEGDVMGILQAAADLLEDESGQFEASNKKDGLSNLTNSFGTTSLERGVEMITYLVSQTHVKEEICGGFRAEADSKFSTLECLVQVAEMPKAGGSLSGFGLATIFQHLAVTPSTLKKEHFADKELSAEEYDQLQLMAKSPEEKAMFEAIKEDDTEDLCKQRIRAMAKANVPRALVQLMDGASDQTLEQIFTGLNRMSTEPSARGQMIQQGGLTACINVDKDSNPTDLMKKVIRLARHTIARMLVTMNPSLLTSAQCMGSIKPLIELIRDVEALDLQVFEALMALTNICASGEDKKNKIVAEKGISTIHYCMFSEHDLIRKAATEAMCNLVGNREFAEHLAEPDHLRMWLAFAADYEENYECARAAAGCLAMASPDPTIAKTLVNLPKFKVHVDELLQSGALELMHRVLSMLLNLVAHGGDIKEAIISNGFSDFCLRYVESYHDGKKSEDLGFPKEQKHLFPVTVDLAKKIVAMSET